jgi:hypothetical protein
MYGTSKSVKWIVCVRERFPLMQNVWMELEYRHHAYRVTNGEHNKLPQSHKRNFDSHSLMYACLGAASCLIASQYISEMEQIICARPVLL